MRALPSTVNDLVSLAEHVANGLETHGPCLGMTEIPSGEFRRLLDQAGQAEAAWSAAENARLYSQARMETANQDVTAWLEKARLVVKLARGEKWSKQWIDTGFLRRAANIPKRIGAKIELARRVVIFLSRHPEYGVPFAGVTATRGRSIYERMVHARDALELVVSDCAAKKRLRDATARLLRRAVRQIIRSLNSTIAPNDLPWLALYLDGPASKRTEQHHIPHQPFLEVLSQPEPIPLSTETAFEPARTAAA